MAQITADSVRFEVITQGDNLPELRVANEDELFAKAVEFFGHDDLSHNGYRHDPEKPGMLRSYNIFFDETPYSD
jgi:hypothetical protein